MTALPSVNVKRLKDVVYGTLKQGILSRTFPPGHRLNIDELAEQLGVSRTPVRDALNILATEGLVEVAPRKGTFVAGLSAQAIAEVFDVRRALELLAGELLITRITPEGIAQLEGRLLRLDRAAERGDAEGHVKANMAFHQLFVRLAGNTKLSEVTEALEAHIQIARIHAGRSDWQRRLQRERTEHREIIAALEHRDRSRLLAAVDAHIRRAKESLIQDFEANAEPDRRNG